MERRSRPDRHIPGLVRPRSIKSLNSRLSRPRIDQMPTPAAATPASPTAPTTVVRRVRRYSVLLSDCSLPAPGQSSRFRFSRYPVRGMVSTSNKPGQVSASMRRARATARLRLSSPTIAPPHTSLNISSRVTTEPLASSSMRKTCMTSGSRLAFPDGPSTNRRDGLTRTGPTLKSGRRARSDNFSTRDYPPRWTDPH